MSIQASRLVKGSLLTTVAVAYYSGPPGTTSVVRRAIFCNVTNAPVSITVYVVPSGGNPGPSNEVIPGWMVGQNSTYVSPELAGMTLGPGDTLQALASVGAAIVFMASGLTIT